MDHHPLPATRADFRTGREGIYLSFGNKIELPAVRLSALACCCWRGVREDSDLGVANVMFLAVSFGLSVDSLAADLVGIADASLVFLPCGC